jgi:hypothetical protein
MPRRLTLRWRVTSLPLGRPLFRIGAGDVAGVAAILASGFDQDQLPAGERPVTRREVQDGRIRAAADDGVEGKEVGAAAEELRLELELNLALRRARHKQGRGSR